MRDGLLCSISSSSFFFFVLPPPPPSCFRHASSTSHLSRRLLSVGLSASTHSARSCPLPVAFCVLLTQLPLPPPPRPAYKRRGQQPTDTPHPREEDGLSTCHDGSLAALLSLPCTGVRCLSPSVARFPSAGFTPGFTFARVFFFEKAALEKWGVLFIVIVIVSVSPHLCPQGFDMVCV